MNRERKPRYSFHDQHIEKILESKFLHTSLERVPSFQGNSSIIKKFCVNALSLDENYRENQVSLAWSPCGSKLITATPYEIEEWKNHSQYREMGHVCTRKNSDFNDITCAIPAPEDGGCVFANFNEILIYDARDQEEPRSIASCHTNLVFKLAFSNGNPNVVWSGSYDGTVREHDTREPPCGDDCKKVILELKREGRNSLAYRPTGLFDIYTLDFSPISSDLMFIGGSDRFGRLYDRRNLSVGGCSRKKKSLPVNYYCPKHLSMQSNVPKFPGKSTPHVYEVAFSPHEFEVLMSYAGEHIYVMNINHDGTSEELYSPDDVLKTMKFDGNRYESPILKNTKRDIRIRGRVRNSLKDCTSIYEGIDILDAVLSLPGRPIGSGVICEWLCLRASLLLERKWKNDVYMAIKDCDTARRISGGNYRPLYCLSKALLQLGRHTEGLQFARAALPLNPPISKVMNWIEMFHPAGSTVQSDESPSWIDGEILASSNKPSEGMDWSTDFKAVDMKQRFIGHLRDVYPICDAGFLGPTGEYVVSASEGDRIYIWEKRSGRLVRTLKDRELTIGRRLKCHPFEFSLVTAHRGLQLWHPDPVGDEYIDDDLEEIKRNQRRLIMGLDKYATLLPDLEF